MGEILRVVAVESRLKRGIAEPRILSTDAWRGIPTITALKQAYYDRKPEFHAAFLAEPGGI